MIEDLSSLLRNLAAKQPRAVAVESADDSWTFSDLDHQATALASYLIRTGLAEGSRVVFIARNAGEFAIALFACARSGCVFVPVNFKSSAAELAFACADAQVRCIIAAPEFAALADQACASLPGLNCRISLGSQDIASWISWGEALSGGKDSSKRHHPVVCQMYTSGTTGRPKGAQLAHVGFLHLLRHAPRIWGHWDETDVNLIVTPLSHIGGTVLLLVALAAGARSILRAEFDPQATLRDIGTLSITRMFLVPTMISALLEEQACRHTDFRRIRQIVYAAAPISKALQQRSRDTFQCDLAQVYGMTETTGAVTYLSPEDHIGPNSRLSSCGKAMPGTDIRILDSDLAPVAPGTTGEIAIRSPQNMLGYWGHHESDGPITADGWLRTGDAGMLDEDGFLYVRDRLKDMIITGGENVYPAEVEAAIVTHPSIVEAAIIGLPDEHWGEVVAAVVVLRPGHPLSLDELRRHARQSLTGYKLPRRLIVRQSLEKNATGKALRNALRDSLPRDQLNWS